MSRNFLEIRGIADVTGTLRIPAYQRGYRWTRRQVEQLLDDLAEHRRSTPYYLQPIVVAPAPDGAEYDFDVIDGQQRLTTVYLILQALRAAKDFNGEVGGEDLKKLYALSGNLDGLDTSVNYRLIYETRSESRDFLQKIAQINADDDEISATPDHLYMWHAYKIAEQWIRNNVNKVRHVADALVADVKVIWYELPAAVLGWKKFAELNVGKIPLTNSELVKALLMRSDNYEITDEQKKTIVQQWDMIEKALDDDSLWGFLTSAKKESYSTRIDLIFDIIAGKPKDSADDYFTFNHFESKFAAPDAPFGKDKWNNIYLEYQRLHDWYADRELYHKIGFLTTLDKDDKTLQELFDFATKVDAETKTLPTHSQFMAEIERRICEAVKLPEGVERIDDLAYKTADDSTAQQDIIKRLLTLYNVLYTLNNTVDRYDFAAHKDQGWSLEHIHAQHSVALDKREQRQEWVESHAKSLERYKISAEGRNLNESVIDGFKSEMEYFAANPMKLDGEVFNRLVARFHELVASPTDPKYEHLMANMALLSTKENAAFNNSTFDVKRRKMLRDMAQEHIPVCTRRVFLKSIEDADDNHPYFWGDADREAYLADIRRVLAAYLSEPIQKKEDEHPEQ